TINTLLKEYQYTSNSGSPLISLGERVRVADDYSDVNAGGKVFQFMGSDRVFDLGTANYADFELWKELMDTNVISKAETTAATKAKSGDAIGVVIALNTVGWAADNVLFALLDALLGSSYLTNERPVTASAYLLDSTVDVAGDLSVVAESAASIVADLGNEQVD